MDPIVETPAELITWQKRTFFIKMAFYILVLSLLAIVAYRGFDDPCERCMVKVASLGDETMTCREALKQAFNVGAPLEGSEPFSSTPLNFSLG